MGAALSRFDVMRLYRVCGRFWEAFYQHMMASQRSPASHGARSSSDDGERSARTTITLDDCIGRLSRRVGHAGQLTTKAHESAVRVLANIRDRIMRGEQAGAASNVLLVCCGVSVERRRLLTGERDELRADYFRTAVLIFVTICLIEHQRRGELEDDEADKHIKTLQRAASASLWRRIRPTKKKREEITRPRPPPVAVLDPTRASAAPGQQPNPPPPPPPSWSDVIEEAEVAQAAPPSDGDVSYSALCSGVMMLGSNSIETFEALSEIFYRHTALQLASNALRKAADADFLSLSAATFCGAVSTDGVSPAKCNALISAGESEAGQQVCVCVICIYIYTYTFSYVLFCRHAHKRILLPLIPNHR